jgi:hypothetical protein
MNDLPKYEMTAQRLQEIESQIDDKEGLLIQPSTLKHLIEEEVNLAVERIYVAWIILNKK